MCDECDPYEYDEEDIEGLNKLIKTLLDLDIHNDSRTKDWPELLEVIHFISGHTGIAIKYQRAKPSLRGSYPVYRGDFNHLNNIAPIKIITLQELKDENNKSIFDSIKQQPYF